MSSTDLYRLSGIKDKTESGHEKIKIKYEKLLDYMSYCKDINIVVDSIFITNEVYSRLGYLKYSFTNTYKDLLKKLDELDNFNIFMIFLYLEDENNYSTRLKREKHSYQKFEVESSVKQQNEYLKIADEVEQATKNIKVIKFENGTMEKMEEKLEDLFSNLYK